MKVVTFILVAIVGCLLAWWLGSHVQVSVSEPTTHASYGLPDGVEKFEDGEVTCYLFARFQAFANTDRVGGISCVKN